MTYDIKKTLEKVGLPLMVTFGSPALCFIVDTGSTHNVLFSFVWEAMADKFQPIDTMIQMSGIEGIRANSRQVKGIVEFDNKKIEVTFAIVDANEAVAKIQNESGVQIHGILGIPFLVENKWILDFNRLTING